MARKKQKKLYRTIIRFEILSEEKIGDGLSLSDIDEMTTNGHCSGRFLKSEEQDKIIKGKAAADATKAQGSDPEFFQMDENGNELEEDF